MDQTFGHPLIGLIVALAIAAFAAAIIYVWYDMNSGLPDSSASMPRRPDTPL